MVVWKGRSREYVKIPNLKVSDTFNTFGIELETIVKNRYDMGDKGLAFFRIVGDGSLSHDGAEFVSSVLENKKGFGIIEDFGKFAKEHLEVNRSCGFHVHLFMHDKLQTMENLQKIFKAYYNTQDFWFSMVSRSRRHNSYCQRLNKEDYDKIMSFRNLDEFIKWFYHSREKVEIDYLMREKYHEKRYGWINLHSLFFRDTLEIRLHQGTVNPTKIINWINLHQIFLNHVLNSDLNDLKFSYSRFISLFPKELQDYFRKRQKELKRPKKQFRTDLDRWEEMSTIAGFRLLLDRYSIGETTNV